MYRDIEKKINLVYLLRLTITVWMIFHKKVQCSIQGLTLCLPDLTDKLHFLFRYSVSGETIEVEDLFEERVTYRMVQNGPHPRSDPLPLRW